MMIGTSVFIYLYVLFGYKYIYIPFTRGIYGYDHPLFFQEHMIFLISDICMTCDVLIILQNNIRFTYVVVNNQPILNNYMS